MLLKQVSQILGHFQNNVVYKWRIRRNAALHGQANTTGQGRNWQCCKKSHRTLPLNQRSNSQTGTATRPPMTPAR